MHTFRYQILRQLHCWLALPLALFLIVLGLTGSAIAWMDELDVFLNPALLQVTVDNTRLEIPALLTRLNKLPEYEHPFMLELPEKKNAALIAWYKNNKTMRQVMINPYTGVVIGERNWDEIGLSRRLLMPTLFQLHRNLFIGETGKIVVSIIAILLAIIALSGIYLWWPVWRLKVWWQAITVSHQGSWKRFNFRLHRAAGFYSAPVFLMLAVTGIYFNKPQWIVPIVTNATQPATTGKPVENLPTLESIKGLPLEVILSTAQNQFPLARISRINFPATSTHFYEIRLHQPGELRAGSGATRVTIDGIHGKIIKIQDPLKAKKGDLLFSYFFPLHSGEIFGIVGKILISLFGLMPLLFTVSGTLIWLRRRQSKKS